MRADLSLHPQPQTAGALFNRKSPRNAAGEVQPILDRRGNVREGVNNYVLNKGKDFTGLHDRSRFKYRIPNTSVVNKVGDCKLFCCLGWRLTAAQWIWLLNLVCFLAHTTMVFVVAYFSWISKDLSKYDTNPYHITIYRVTAQWTNETSQVYTMAVEDNQMPFDLAIATLCFFLISAIFHLFALIAGLFESLWFYYWRYAHTQTHTLCYLYTTTLYLTMRSLLYAVKSTIAFATGDGSNTPQAHLSCRCSSPSRLAFASRTHSRSFLPPCLSRCG